MKIVTIISVFSLLLPAVSLAETQELRTITFPVNGAHSFSDDYGDPRSGGRVHEGIDITAAKMTPVVSAVGGYVSSLPQEEPSYGFTIIIRGNDGYSYHYLHINNDTPGTDDGLGGPPYAYAPGIERGSPVVAGQHIGWVGDSGNAENIGSHLHFEIRLPDHSPINPYPSLVVADSVTKFDPAKATQSAPTINDDKQLVANFNTVCESNTLIKGSLSAVYYCGADNKRYVFPNQKTYISWYPDFTGVVKITDTDLANIPLGGNVTSRPGVRMVKVPTDPHVYVVQLGGVLRHVTSPDIAVSMYGANWSKQVDDLPEAFFVNYSVGAPVTSS